ncbi:DUF3613 domain-containing protein [Paraburkholderia pallida]|uniref:DUF3613 domain-containing protein n=2 Tax=Paraburkholderia pallida TaxID=2547399 RepID=A0A4P7CX50_9BURK|nr:DUF3613 domain-containing protein [Paraburkholderia pallida]
MRCRHAAVVAAAIVSMALAAPAAHAQGADAQASVATVPDSEIGHSTRAWLELQRSNAEAAPPLPMLGAEAGYAYRRYMKSFDTEIPASFGSTVQTGGGQGGAGGSASPGSGGAY